MWVDLGFAAAMPRSAHTDEREAAFSAGRVGPFRTPGGRSGDSTPRKSARDG